jgi:hypothetical protein
MKKLLFSLSISCALIYSCDKPAEATTATINFIEPAVGDTIHLGELHGYTLKIENTITSEIVKTGSTSNHAKSYVFHEHWVNNVSEPSLMKVTLEVELNHDGKKTSKELNVVCLPN